MPNVQEAIYARISQDQTGARLGVERQAAAVRKHFGLPADTPVYEDNDMSATTGKRRPEFERLLEDLHAGTVRRVYCWHTDRLQRTPKDLELLIDACKAHGATVQALQAGMLDLSTPAGQAVARTVVAWHKYETDMSAERRKAANLQRAQAGAPYRNGVRLFGYQVDGVTQIRQEAAAVKRAARAVLSGRTLASVCRDLEAAGIKTTRGNAKWSIAGLRTVLLNPRYAGKLIYQGVEYQGQWRPILTADTHAAIVAKLTDPERRTNNAEGTSAKWLLSGGVARCGLCFDNGEDSPMVTNYAGKHAGHIMRRRLMCGTHRHVTIQAEPVERVVEMLMRIAALAAFDTSDSAREFAAGFGIKDPTAGARILARLATTGDDSEHLAELHEQRDGYRARLAEIDTALANPAGAPVASLLAARAKLADQFAAAEREIGLHVANPAAAKLAAAKDVATAWQSLEIAERRGLIREALALRLYSVGRGNTLDQHNITRVIQWEWRG